MERRTTETRWRGGTEPGWRPWSGLLAAGALRIEHLRTNLRDLVQAGWFLPWFQYVGSLSLIFVSAFLWIFNGETTPSHSYAPDQLVSVVVFPVLVMWAWIHMIGLAVWCAVHGHGHRVTVLITTGIAWGCAELMLDPALWYVRVLGWCQ